MTTKERIYSYFDREPGLRVLFVFDKMAAISPELRDESWEEEYVYHEFDGRWFTLKYRLANEWADKRVVLLFPEEMKPTTAERRSEFQLLDVLVANTEFRQDNYEEFIQQYSLPAHLTGFVRSNIAELMSTKVMAIISPYLRADTFNEDYGVRGLISSYLGEKKLLDWEGIVVKMMLLDLAPQSQRYEDFYVKLDKNKSSLNKLNQTLTSIFGVSFAPNKVMKMRAIAESLKYNAITQSVAVVEQDPYRSLKATNPLAIERLNRIFEKGINDVQLKERFSEALKLLAAEIREERIIEVYGTDAPYFFFTEELCLPILKKLAKTALADDPETALERVRAISLRLSPASGLMNAVALIELTAQFVRASRDLGSMHFATPAEYVTFYTERFATVDRLYRKLVESSRPVKIPAEFENTAEIIKQTVDAEYARIANVLNLHWIRAVKADVRLFAATGLPKQNDFYFTVKGPAIKKMVVVVSDALRYEMGQELLEKIAGTRHVATIYPMLAMLPTETKYCKPSLLPHRRLTLSGDAMLVDGQSLSSLTSRQQLLQSYAADGLCLDYKELLNGGKVMDKRDLFKSRSVVYIFHNTIDEAGHDGITPEACSSALEELKELVARLHASWNVVNVFVTSDHGFLFNDIPFGDKDKHSIAEMTIEKKTRYYLTPSGSEQEGISKFPLNRVSGIESPDLINVAVPDGTNRFAAPGGYGFAHGGASLQEMIVPVIHSHREQQDKTEKVGVALMDHNLNIVSSRLKLRLIQSDPVTMTTTERTVVCQVFDGDTPVTDQKLVTLSSTDGANLNNRLYEITLRQTVTDTRSTLQLRVWDKEQPLNPLITETVKNNTIIEQDF